MCAMLEKERMEVVESKSASSSFARPRGDSLTPIFLCASSLPQPSTVAKTAAISRHCFIDMNCLPAHEEDEEQEEEEQRANLLPFSLTVQRSSNSSSSSLFARLATSTKAAGLNSAFNLCSNNSSHCNYGDLEQEEEEEEEEEEEDGVGGGGGGATKKKLRLSKEQSGILEESFREHSSLNPKLKNALAAQLDLKPRQVEVWFQNRRARTKLKKTEVECEVLKRCCSSLTEENRRLQKEVQELRALKVPPPSVYSQDYFMALPATTLSMCPSCEKIASNSIDNSLANQSLQYSHFFPHPLRQSSTAS